MAFFSLEPRFKPVVGLDITTSSVKAVEIRPVGKEWRLHRCGLKLLPPEVVVDSQIKDLDAVSKAVGELLQEAKITTKQVALSVSGSGVIIKKIQLAAMPELELEDQITVEAEEYIPFDIEEVFLDFQILGREGDHMEVLLVACKKEMVANYQRVADTLGLKVQVLDLDLFAIANAYRQVIRAPDQKGAEVVALVNAGASVINVTILNNGVPSFTRDHQFGGRHLTEEIQRHYDVNFEEAERIQMGGNAPSGYQSEVVQPFLEQFYLQISQSLDTHQAGQPVDKVVVSGGCAVTPGLVAYVQEQSGLTVSLADPFSRLKGVKEALSGGPCGGLAHQFMVPLGLALRGGER